MTHTELVAQVAAQIAARHPMVDEVLTGCTAPSPSGTERIRCMVARDSVALAHEIVRAAAKVPCTCEQDGG